MPTRNDRRATIRGATTAAPAAALILAGLLLLIGP
jgi:hypothetical protein